MFTNNKREKTGKYYPGIIQIFRFYLFILYIRERYFYTNNLILSIIYEEIATILIRSIFLDRHLWLC